MLSWIVSQGDDAVAAMITAGVMKQYRDKDGIICVSSKSSTLGTEEGGEGSAKIDQASVSMVPLVLIISWKC